MKFLFTFFIVMFSYSAFAQNLNMIIEVNEKLVISGGFDLHFEYLNGKRERILIGYEPGELKLNGEAWNAINSDSIKNITLTFAYNDFEKEKNHESFYEIEMEKHHFTNHRYLILQIYDFCERKYRKRYSCLTDEDYIWEYRFPNCGVLVSCG